MSIERPTATDPALGPNSADAVDFKHITVETEFNPAPDGWRLAPTESEPDRIERTDAVDLNPERCPHTWTPAMGTPLGRVFANVRCTQRVDDGHGDNHYWDARQQERWSRETIRSFVDALDDEAPALDEPPMPLRGDELTETDDRILEAFDDAIGIRRGLRAVAAIGWDEGHAATDDHSPGLCECPNPYRAIDA